MGSVTQASRPIHVNLGSWVYAPDSYIEVQC